MRREARKRAKEESPSYRPPPQRKCSQCIHAEFGQKEVWKNIQKTFTASETGEKKWKSQRVGTPVKVGTLRCNYYNEMIGNEDRAIRCPHFIRRTEQATLDAYEEHEGDIREWVKL
jgi:hypothetical protein